MSIENIKKLREMTGAGMMDVKKALDATNNDIDAAVKWLRENGVAKAAKKAGRIAAEGIVLASANDSRAAIIEVNSETDFVSKNEKFISKTNEVMQAILNSSAESTEDALKVDVNGSTVEQVMIDLTATIGEKIELRRVRACNLDGRAAGVYMHSNSRIATIVVGEGMSSDVLRDIAMHATAMRPQYMSQADIDESIVKSETELAKKELADTLAGKPENVQENIIKGKVNKVLNESVLLEQTFVKDPSKKVKDLQGSGKLCKFVRYEVGEGIEKREENFADEVAAQMKAAKQ